MRLYFPSARTLGCVVWPEIGTTHSQGIPPDFYPPHMNGEWPFLQATTATSPGCTMSSPLQIPVSAPPTSLVEYGFFKSLVVRLPYGSIFWQFWVLFALRLIVILLVVAKGGEACLPMPPI